MARRLRIRRKPVLIVQHAPHEHAAALRRALESQGVLTVMVYPYTGQRFPSVEDIGGIISLGGPMGANDTDEHSWIRHEIELLGKCVRAKLPVAGICLGGQMLARAMGARVERHHTAEVGWFPLELTTAGAVDRVLGVAGASPMVYHWHGDTFLLPPDAELLARSRACERQAYRVADNAYGFQFHPEADHQLVLEWLAVEGMEEDIHEFRVRMGACHRSVQEARIQRAIALKCEKASLKITAAIGTLFRAHEEAEVADSRVRDLQSWTTRRESVELDFLGSTGRTVRLRGKIDALLSIAAGDFVILAEENSLLWPIRVGDIRRIAPITEVSPARPGLRASARGSMGGPKRIRRPA